MHIKLRSQPQKTLSILHRPQLPTSQGTAENIDVQFERDKHAFERHANIYRSLAHENYHHNKVGYMVGSSSNHLVPYAQASCDPVNFMQMSLFMHVRRQ